MTATWYKCLKRLEAASGFEPENNGFAVRNIAFIGGIGGVTDILILVNYQPVMLFAGKRKNREKGG